MHVVSGVVSSTFLFRQDLSWHWFQATWMLVKLEEGIKCWIPDLTL